MNQFGRNLRTIGIIYLSRYQEAAQAFCAPFIRAVPTKIHFFTRRNFPASRPEYLCSWDSSHLKLKTISPVS